MTANYITVIRQEGKEDQLIQAVEQTNPTILPRQGELINFQGERFEVSGVEWLPLLQKVNIYMIRYKG